jgi:hypothetical protein
MQMMRQGGGRDADLVLQMPDRQAILARPYQGAVHFQARRVAEGFELLGRFFDFHGNKIAGLSRKVKNHNMLKPGRSGVADQAFSTMNYA